MLAWERFTASQTKSQLGLSMRKKRISLSLSLFAGFLSVAASANAAPILYDINFNVEGPPVVVPTGSFIFDAGAVNNPFSAFVINFNGVAFDFTAMANSETITDCGEPSGPATIFDDLIGGCGIRTWSSPGDSDQDFTILFDTSDGNLYEAVNDSNPISVEIGYFTVTNLGPSPVPEPGTSSLMILAGVGALCFSRRCQQIRYPRRRSQTR